MAAPILWTSGKCVLSAGKTSVHKIPPFFWGGMFWVLGGGGSADFIFMGAGIFLIKFCFEKKLGNGPNTVSCSSV